ncbi:hypothetical protein ACO2RV_21830 [Ancylobacter sp. VNQ12]|uniref:hypothetical protein n=1 Tax=Ancylobacter sp. VNQ12 TaxID=3400920 RepID=UPI003C0D7BF9
MSALSERLSAAFTEFEALRQAPDFDETTFSRYDADAFAERHGLDGDELFAIVKHTRPKASADRFKWLEAVNARRDIGVRGLRTAVALFSFADDTGFPFPSQQALARRAGYRDDAEIRRGLASLVAIGALRKVRVTNLPPELAAKALGPRKAGGSGRSKRGTAYALVPPAEWPRNAQTGTPCPSRYRDTVSLLNHQDKPPPASQDSSHSGKEGRTGSVAPSGTVLLGVRKIGSEGPISVQDPTREEARNDAA